MKLTVTRYIVTIQWNGTGRRPLPFPRQHFVSATSERHASLIGRAMAGTRGHVLSVVPRRALILREAM